MNEGIDTVSEQQEIPVQEDAYAGVREKQQTLLPAPNLPYRPIEPQTYHPAIALIGCGGITGAHLAAYQAAGYNVVALCDLDEARAANRRAAFYPQASVYTDYRDVLRRDDVEVVDIATHPDARVPLIEASLQAGKHVLSQKPFVLDLDIGERLCDLAARQQVQLAVNQNGRWAPHVAYIRHAIADGLVGDIVSADFAVSFDHSWVVGTPFDEMYDLVLYDFAIHWFDMLSCYLMPQEPTRVFAAVGQAKGQTPKPPLLAHVLVDYPAAQATLSFNAAAPFGHRDRTYLVGTKAIAHSFGPGLQDQTVQVINADGVMQPELIGNWFNDGFHGAMAELLCAIEERRTPPHNAVDNLRSLALAFAAIGSAHNGSPMRPGEVRRLPGT